MNLNSTQPSVSTTVPWVMNFGQGAALCCQKTALENVTQPSMNQALQWLSTWGLGVSVRGIKKKNGRIVRGVLPAAYLLCSRGRSALCRCTGGACRLLCSDTVQGPALTLQHRSFLLTHVETETAQSQSIPLSISCVSVGQMNPCLILDYRACFVRFRQQVSGHTLAFTVIGGCRPSDNVWTPTVLTDWASTEHS